MRTLPAFHSSLERGTGLLGSLTLLGAFGVLLLPNAKAQMPPATAPPAWNSAGQDLGNTRSQPQEFQISHSTVENLQAKWTFTTQGDVSATPTVAGGVVYFPDLSGNLYAVNTMDGSLIWTHKISEYNNVANSITRVSPAIDGNYLLIGDHSPLNKVRSGAYIISVDRRTGNRRWMTQVESHPAAIITGSPIVYNGVIYIGVSSQEEGLAEQASYPCCTFRGSVVALDDVTGKVLWKTYTVPDNGGKPGGYSGASVWSPPAIDTVRNTLYVGTANNYTAPGDVAACENADPTRNCAVADDYFDSVLSLDLKTGQIKWGTHLRLYDIWTLACIRPGSPRANCLVPSSPDSGSGSGPNLIGDKVGVGQKDGLYWALDADTGNPVWKTQVGPGGSSGGVQWGTATNNGRIYVASANSDGKPYKLIPSGNTITWGAWSALDARTGRIMWQTADPTEGASDPGAVSIANGVMYAGSSSGHMYALDTGDGSILWQFDSGGAVIDGPSIVDGALYWGSGYGSLANNKVFSFGLK